MPTSKKHVEFAICVENEGYDDLEVWKVYQVLPDARAAGVGCIRVIDESERTTSTRRIGSRVWNSPRLSGRAYRDGSQEAVLSLCKRPPKKGGRSAPDRSPSGLQ